MDKQQTLEDLTNSLGLKPNDWDVLLIGDGSATSWNSECGWCSALIMSDFTRELFYGGCNKGTTSIAELMAYALPLLYLTSGGVNGYDMSKGCRVSIVSDSKYVVNGLNGASCLKSNLPLWSVVATARRNGCILRGHWAARETYDLNKLCHAVANRSRVWQKDLVNQVVGSKTVYNFNPDA